jgi:hypothetical protein
VDGYLRGQVFNREVPEVEDLYYRLSVQPQYTSLFATNNQLSSTSDADDIALSPDFHRVDVSTGFGGIFWQYGIGAPQQQAVRYQLPEYLDSKKAVREVFSIYGYRYLVYVRTVRIQQEIQYYRPIPALPSGAEDFNPELELNLDFYKRLKGDKLKFKKRIAEMSGYSAEGWKLFVYPNTDPVNGGGWYHYFNAEIALELDVTTGLTRQIPRTP